VTLADTSLMGALCDPWGIWDTREGKWAHDRLGTQRAAERGALRANSTRNPWVTGDRFEARRYDDPPTRPSP
jgi:hypothetical protein